MKCENKQLKKAPKLKDFNDEVFQKRIAEQYDRIYELYDSIYHNDEMFDSLINTIYDFYHQRSEKLKKIDQERLNNPKWFCQNDSIAIQFYTEKFADTLRGVESKLDYLQKIGVKIVYALPLLGSPKGKSDGGFAVSDFRNVREDIGTMDDLEHLIDTLHERGMSFCMDYILNHTSDEHEWAKRAKNGEIEYQNRYYFYDSWYKPNKFDSYGVMGHFFGDIAPDNFTYVSECHKILMTTFYPYQWDLNFTNPVVFNEVISNILFLMNRGVDIIVFNGTPNMWKKAGTSCQNLKPSYMINYIICQIMKIVSPGCASFFDLKRHKKRTESLNMNLNLNPNNNIDDESNDESESENEKEYVITESGVITADAAAETRAEYQSISKLYYLDNEEEEEFAEFDLSTEIGQLHTNFGWESRLWASLAFANVHSISHSIRAICNRFVGDAYFTRVHSHDDINWGLGFDVELNSLIGNGLGSATGYHGGIITLYRYLNDFYTGNMPGSFSKGITFAENLVTGKARLCGTTASLLGLEKSLNQEESIIRKINEGKMKKDSSKLIMAQNNVQNSIDRILLLHAVSASMPSIFIIYSGDEIGELNDYSYIKDPNICDDNRYVARRKFNWESAKLIDNDTNSYQFKIFNGIKRIISARKNFKEFTENEQTIFLKNIIPNNDDDETEAESTVLIFKRIRNGGKYLLFIFNFCKYIRHINISKKDADGKYRDLISNKIFDQINSFKVKAYEYLWLEPIA